MLLGAGAQGSSCPSAKPGPTGRGPGSHHLGMKRVIKTRQNRCSQAGFKIETGYAYISAHLSFEPSTRRRGIGRNNFEA